MKYTMSKAILDEVQASCCMEIGTMIDNQHRTISISESFPDEASAHERVRYLLAQADSVASEAVIAEQSIASVAANSVSLSVQITFCCEVECINFELKLR